MQTNKVIGGKPVDLLNILSYFFVFVLFVCVYNIYIYIVFVIIIAGADTLYKKLIEYLKIYACMEKKNISYEINQFIRCLYSTQNFCKSKKVKKKEQKSCSQRKFHGKHGLNK